MNEKMRVIYEVMKKRKLYALSDDELAYARDHFEKLKELLEPLGPVFHLAYQEVRHCILDIGKEQLSRRG